MKSAVILIFCIAGLQVAFGRSIRSAEDLTELEPEELQCVEELKLNKEEIIRINNQPTYPENHNDFSKFMECYFNKMGWIDNGKIDYDNLKASLEEITQAELVEESPAVQELVKIMMTGTVKTCQKQGLPAGISIGVAAIKTHNCIVNEIVNITAA